MALAALLIAIVGIVIALLAASYTRRQTVEIERQGHAGLANLTAVVSAGYGCIGEVAESLRIIASAWISPSRLPFMKG